MSDLMLRIMALGVVAVALLIFVRDLRASAGWVLVGMLLVALRPPALGGQTTLVFVSGVSMEPNLHTGDLALIVPQGTYCVGDVVAYHPTQATDTLIIHRVVGGDDASGYVIRGDNRSSDDLDRPTPEQIVGRALVVLPSVGWFFAGLRVPVLLGFVVALVAMWFAWDYLFETRKEEGLT